jgi:hypothetical protein
MIVHLGIFALRPALIKSWSREGLINPNLHMILLRILGMAASSLFPDGVFWLHEYGTSLFRSCQARNAQVPSYHVEETPGVCSYQGHLALDRRAGESFLSYTMSLR